MRISTNKPSILALVLLASGAADLTRVSDAATAVRVDNDRLAADIAFSQDLARFRFFDLAVDWLASVEKRQGISEDERIDVSLAKARVAELASSYAVTRSDRMKFFDESAAHYKAAIDSMPVGMSPRKAQATADGLARVYISKGTFYNEELQLLQNSQADAALIKSARDNAEEAFKGAVTTLNTVYGDVTDYISENELEEDAANELMGLGLYALYRKGESYYHWALLYEPQEFNREDYLSKCIEALSDYIWEAGDGGVFPLLAYYFQGMSFWELGKIQADQAAQQDAKAIAQLQPIYGEFGINDDKLKEFAGLGEDERRFVLSILERAYRGESDIYRDAASRFEASPEDPNTDLSNIAFEYTLIKNGSGEHRPWQVEGPVTKGTIVGLLRNAAVGVVTELEQKLKKYGLGLTEEGNLAMLAKARALVDLGRGGEALSIVKDVAQSQEGTIVGMEANGFLSELLEVTDQSSQPADIWMMAGDGAFDEERWLDAVDAYHKAVRSSKTDAERQSFQSTAWARIAECYQKLGRNLEAALAFDAGFKNAKEIRDETGRDELALSAYNAWSRRFSETRSSFDEKERNRIRDEVTRLGISGDIQFLKAREAFVNASAQSDPAAKKAAYTDAIKEFDGVVESSAFYERGLVYKARSYAEIGDTNKAIATFDELLKRVNDPKKQVGLDKKKAQQRSISTAEATYYKAGVLLEAERYPEVLTTLSGFESNFDTQKNFFPAVNYFRVKALVATSQLKEAEDLTGRMKSEYKSSNQTNYAVNQVAVGHYAAYRELEDKTTPAAIAHLRSAAEYLSDYNQATGFSSFQNLVSVGDWYKDIGETAIAEENYRRALNQFGKNPKYQKAINDSVKRSLAEVLLAQSNFADALPLWRDVYASNSRSREVLRSLARCLGGWLEDTQTRGVWQYQEVTGVGQYEEAMVYWGKLKDGIEGAGEKSSDAWWETMTNLLYCQYMRGKTEPQARASAQKLITQWKAIYPALGGEPHSRRMARIEQALR